MELSKSKKSFLESLDININNLPDEFKKYNSSYRIDVDKKQQDFLFFHAPKFSSKFCMRDIVGTKHPDYENMNFFESFLATKRGDIMVNAYNNNPGYYEKTLKQPDQSYETCRHDTPIELYKVDEKYYVIGGNNRINIMMMLYLADLSKAKTEDEKQEVYKKHTYYAVVKSVPKNKKIVNVINLLKGIYKNISFEFAGKNPDDCIWNININGIKHHVDSYQKLYELFKDAYLLNNVKNEKDLTEILDKLFLDLNCSFYGDKVDHELINGLYPKLDELQKLYIVAKQNDILSELNYVNLSYDSLLNQLKLMIPQFLEKSHKEKVNKAQKYFIDCKNISEFVICMDALIGSRFEYIFNDVIESYSAFKRIFLEARDYLIKNHSSDVMEFTYDNIYKYIIKILAEKKKEECEIIFQEINSLEIQLSDINKKILIEKNYHDYLIISSGIEELSYEKDILEQKQEEKTRCFSNAEEELTNIHHKIDEIKSKNIFLRIFYLKALKRLKKEYKLTNSNMLAVKDEILNIRTQISNLSNEMANKKREFSLRLEHGLTFDNFILEQERLKSYSSSSSILKQEIEYLKNKISKFYYELENKKLELDGFCKKYNVTDDEPFKK